MFASMARVTDRCSCCMAGGGYGLVLVLVLHSFSEVLPVSSCWSLTHTCAPAMLGTSLCAGCTYNQQ